MIVSSPDSFARELGFTIKRYFLLFEINPSMLPIAYKNVYRTMYLRGHDSENALMRIDRQYSARSLVIAKIAIRQSALHEGRTTD